MYTNEYLRTLEVFFKNPRRELYIRELAKMAKVSPAFSTKAVDLLSFENMVLTARRGNMKLARANLDSLVFRYAKITYSLHNLSKAKLLTYLKDRKGISSVVLFGSTARGEDDENSDIDLLIIGTGQSSQTEIESLLKKKVSLIRYTEKEWLEKAKANKAFYERIIIEGIPLYGELPVVV